MGQSSALCWATDALCENRANHIEVNGKIMAAMKFWSRLAARVKSKPPDSEKRMLRIHPGESIVFALDATVVVLSTCLAISMESQLDRSGFSDVGAARECLLLGAISAILTFVTFINWRIYPSLPDCLQLQVREQSWSLLAGNVAGFALYAAWSAAVHEPPQHGLALSTLAASMVVLSVRRLLQCKWSGAIAATPRRNAAVLGTCDEAQSVKRQMQRFRRLGYRFSGFIAAGPNDYHSEVSSELIADIEALLIDRRLKHVDELFVT